jgi:hypothetical protein
VVTSVLEHLPGRSRIPNAVGEMALSAREPFAIFTGLAFAASKFANRLKPLLVMGFRWVVILIVLLQNLALF